MSKYTIIDRRVNPKGKNLSNRQRFLHRARDWIKDKVRKRAAERDITSNDGESISISEDDISEPIFDYDRKKGNWERILPGNKNYIPGDKIKRPDDEEGGGGKEGGTGPDSEDEFSFTITKEEYLDILFEDLELPDLIKESENQAVVFERKRTGFSTAGTPNNLDLEKSLKNALGRRIALGFPLDKRIKEKEDELENAKDDEKELILQEIEELKRRRTAISYIDQVDVRYKRYSQIPLPNSQAVVFCLMDVSGSMGEKEKEIAKRFFLLLYLFLQRKYKTVDIRFVRHTTEARECTEEEFFYDKNNGGTIVSTGIKKVSEIIEERYPLDSWNIYCVQASDGDNVNSDNPTMRDELEKLLPKCQYYVYNEVKQSVGLFSGMTTTNVYDVMKELTKDYKNMNIVKIDSVEEVIPSFRKVFGKKQNGK
jgi:uncharacterized sporulation protein YeaH/YhbH (DUF444 family)